MSLFDQLKPHLKSPEGPDRGGNFKCWCPFHADGEGKPPHEKNLSVHPERGFICHACGARGGLRKLAAELGVSVAEEKDRGRITATYPYHDERGELLFEVVRKEFADGRKTFIQRRPDGTGKWIWNLNDTRRVLYRLPEILKADPTTPIFIVEGEKDADNLHRLGLTATTSPHGAGKWHRLDPDVIDLLRDRAVVILPDNDKPGEAHAKDIAESLAAIAQTVKILELPGLAKKGDVSDWIKAGGTAKQLLELAEQTPERDPTATDTNLQYESTPRGLVWYREVRDQEIAVPLTNFDARIVSYIKEDDGVDESSALEIEATIDDRTERFTVPSSQFNTLNWVMENLGPEAIVNPGQSVKEHTRVAIQRLSGRPARRIVYGHTGWRETESGWTYLHAAGGIGKDGSSDQVQVSLPPSIERYELKDPKDGDLKAAIRASLSIIDLAPETITLPLLAAVYRSVIRESSFAVHLAGPTGEGKSQLAALIQQHFGADLDAEHLPASWSSTGNAIEALSFFAKDAILVVDDFAPNGSSSDIHRFHREADRVFRAQGNRAGRTRMRSDASVRAVKYPRGMILSTGEEIPRGQSLRGRMLILELAPGDVDWEKLTPAQESAGDGQYALALSGFIAWIAARYEALQEEVERQVTALRVKARGSGQHRRTPVIVSNLAVGFQMFLDYAREAGVLDNTEAETLFKRAWHALGSRAEEQTSFQTDSEPASRFLELLSAAIATGDAHVASRDGSVPECPPGWGWRSDTPGGGGEWRPLGKKIGWVDGDDLYLERDAAYAIAEDLCRREGDSLPVGMSTLSKRLNEKGFLKTTDKRRRTLHIRRAIDGVTRAVLHLRAEALRLSERETPIGEFAEGEKLTEMSAQMSASKSLLTDGSPETKNAYNEDVSNVSIQSTLESPDTENVEIEL